MSYTCKDCKVQCIERSREYICTSFKLGEPSDSSVRDKKQFGNKNCTSKSKGRYTASQNVSGGVEKC